LLCFFVIIATTFVSDKTRKRGPWIAFMAVIAAVGFLVLATTTSTGVRYFAMFLTINIFVCVALILAWVSNNSGTDSKRAGGIAVLNIIGQCGPILGTRVFPAADGPFYRKGMWICCGFCFFVGILALMLSYLLWRENKKRDQLYGEGSGVDAFDERVDAGSLGDKAAAFRYVI
jgi:MFS family permease